MLLLPLLLGALFPTVPALNVLLMFPGYSRSHTLFNERMAEVLAVHHNLTVIGNYYFDEFQFHAPEGVNEFRVLWEPEDPEGMDKIIEMMRRVSFQDYSMNDVPMPSAGTYIHDAHNVSGTFLDAPNVSGTFLDASNEATSPQWAQSRLGVNLNLRQSVSRHISVSIYPRFTSAGSK